MADDLPDEPWVCDGPWPGEDADSWAVAPARSGIFVWSVLVAAAVGWTLALLLS